MGVRERKKRRTRATILAVARDRFRVAGVRETRMDAIAEEAEIGTGTLYNYFPSKSALLVALCAEVSDRALERGAEVVAEPGDDPCEAVICLLDVYADVPRELERRLLREVVGAAYALLPDTATSFVAMDMRMMRQLGELLAVLAARGDLRADADLAAATPLFYGIYGSALLGYAGMEDVPLEVLLASVREQVRIVFDGLGARPSGPPENAGDAG